MATSEEDDDMEELQKLQRANEGRWSQLQDLQRQCVELSQTSSHATASTFLQAERDVLIQCCSTTRECDDLLDELEDRHSGENRFGAELVDRCNELYELKLLLLKKVQFQKDVMKKLDHSIKEQETIQKKLKQVQHQLNRVRNPYNTEIRAIDQQENEKLRGDLAYLAGLVAPTETMSTEHPNSSNLNEVMIRLLERHMSSPEEPYLSCHDGKIQKKHVEILKNSWLIDTLDLDENMIRLTDYTQEE